MKIKPTSSRRSRPAQKKSEPQPTTSSITRFLPWAILLLVILLAAIIRLRLLEIPLERDEGEYAYTGQLLLQGIPPYQAAFNMKFPGIYAAYALIMAVFGQTIAGIHFGFLLLNAGTIVLVFLLGRRLFTPAAGLAAAAAYALLSMGSGVYGTQAHATHFVVAAALAATLLLLYALDTGHPATLFLSGFLYAVAILMKQHGAFFVLFGGLYLLWDHWTRHRGGWLSLLRKLAFFVLGSALPLALTALALWRSGVFAKFWFWTFTYAREYASEISFTLGGRTFATAFPWAVGPNLLLWLLAAAGLVILWRRPADRVSAIFVSALLFFSVLSVCPGLYFREHYFVLVLPAIALLAGATVTFKPRISWWVYGAVLVISLGAQSDFLFRMSPIEASHLMYRSSPFPAAIEIAAYLRTHSEPGARIAVLGSEPEIYFYAKRRSATGYIYTYGMMEPQPFALTMQNEMIHDVETVRPEYVVFVNDSASWIRRNDSPATILTWWNAYAAQNYTVVAGADIFSDGVNYYWDHLESYRPRSRAYMVICKRNT